jgi:predicted NAD/FAD-binding protein
MKKTARKRVCIVGAGAAGLSAAWSLSCEGDFDVTVYEGEGHVGGVATTLPVPLPGGGEVRINDQVQGGSPAYRNTRRLFEAFGASLSPVRLRVSIGAGDQAWDNAAATPFIRRMRPEIERFRRLLGVVQRAPAPFAAVSIDALLRALCFSDDFRHHVIYPVMSLFFASGAESRRVPAAVVARIFFDEESKLFDFDAETFLSEAPPMVSFPDLTEIYQKIAASLPSEPRRGSPVLSVARDPRGVTVACRGGAPERFDAIVFACSAERALAVLEDPSPLERFALGSVDYQDVALVTHLDAEYVRRHYGADPGGDVLYFSRNDRRDAARLEVSFNLSRYQPALRGTGVLVFQTCDPIDRIDPAKIVRHRRTRGIKHSTRHFTRLVPLLRFLQGRRRTYFAGAYTLFNIHEIAIVSGLAAAERLGAPYPFRDDPAAGRQFDLYQRAVHG